MKPSERIQEILDEKIKNQSVNSIPTIIGALMDYLDEEYEKNRPCEHDWINIKMAGCKECKKCHIVAYIEDSHD